MKIDYKKQPTQPAQFPVNIIKALNRNKDLNLVQRSLSVSNEDGQNCLQFFGSINKYAKEWISMITKQKYP